MDTILNKDNNNNQIDKRKRLSLGGRLSPTPTLPLTQPTEQMSVVFTVIITIFILVAIYSLFISKRGYY